MPAKQLVLLKGNRDGISVLLDERADFEVIKTQLHAKVAGAKQFFEGANSNIAFKGRALTDDEERALLDVIMTETTMDVSFVEHEDFIPGMPVVNLAPPHLARNESVTTFHRGSLRSGQFIRNSGSVVVLGDANPGSEIVAEENVIVLGSLRGFVHAGCAGNDGCFVSALSLQPTQLRIANIITYIPMEVRAVRNARTPLHVYTQPSYAYIQDGQVYIAPLVNMR